ncbi:hypothetical protein FJZ31_42550 [Candidatus Poribacteria bacterium]|nr:hypothetical protein [Candidatus Poribacteria bacterium]
MNHPNFYKVEVDKEKIESFIREGFERKLGKDNVLDIRLFSYPNEYIAAVTLRKETKEALNIAHELKGIFLDNNLAVGIYTKEVTNGSR